MYAEVCTGVQGSSLQKMSRSKRVFLFFLGAGWPWFAFLQKVGMQLGSLCTRTQVKHWPVGRAGGEGDPASSDKGAQSPAGDN